MRNLIVPLILLSCALCSAQEAANERIIPFFSPAGGCTHEVCACIADAKQSIFVEAYSFTSAPIAKALVDAKRRGVQVQIILDKSNLRDRYSVADFLAHAGIVAHIDTHNGIAHNKVVIIDGKEVLTGSFNFTKAAEEKNEENLIVIQDKSLAEKYLANFAVNQRLTAPYTPRN